MSGVDMAAADYDGRTALHLCAAEGHAACVAFLLEKCGVPLYPKDRCVRVRAACACVCVYMCVCVCVCVCVCDIISAPPRTFLLEKCDVPLHPKTGAYVYVYACACVCGNGMGV